ncbi:Fur-regulated basic protein FbpA [Fictibacillus nanhaiensis]|uniref:Fur-regulated basic protein FbpA n=1 Tax=Fictibacillus nanhaiensis TaxID=742169 RepID=UPI00296E9800
MSADHLKRENLIADLLLHNIYKTADGRHLYELSLQDLEQQLKNLLSPPAEENAT